MKKATRQQGDKATGGTPVLRAGMLVGVAFASCGILGCPARSLMVTQDPYINNAMHRNLSESERTGDPLEVSIVCVYPEDLEKPANQALRPGQNITCKGWYDHRPEASGGADRFDLARNQIHLLTDAAPSQAFGQKKGPALKGAVRDGRSEVPVPGIKFERKLHSANSVIYVFPRFIDKNGEVLPVPPAVFNPPGAYSSGLSVKIGVNAADIKNPASHYGQYITITAPRRLHGAGQ